MSVGVCTPPAAACDGCIHDLVSSFFSSVDAELFALVSLACCMPHLKIGSLSALPTACRSMGCRYGRYSLGSVVGEGPSNGAPRYRPNPTAYTHACTRIGTHVCTRAGTHACAHICTCMHTHLCTCLYTYACGHVCAHVCTHFGKRACACAYTHT